MVGDICSLEKCTGCYACANCCPKGCITLEPRGALGHIYPQINNEKCINCGLCKIVCQANHPVEQLFPIAAYAGWHKKKEEYLSSTSGGAAAALSQKIVRDGGVVYGCVSLDGLVIEHKRIDRYEDLHLLKGSKYVQSSIGNAYKLAKNDLLDGITVLFIGTPCQIAGLKAYLRKEYNNLYTVDLICHGTPSQNLLRKHIQSIANGKGINISFRQGNDMILKVYDEKGEIIYSSDLWRSRYSDVYYNTFIDGYTYRDSCYQCQYATAERCSDITIGDFWGLGDDLERDKNNGCSCILPITEKGKELLLSCDLELHKRPISEAVQGNDQLRSPKEKGKRNRLFDNMAPTVGIKMAYAISEFDRIYRYLIWMPAKRIIRKQIRTFLHF